MKAILIILMFSLASCGEKRDDKKVASALNAVKLAAWHAGLTRYRADRDDASLADGVDYSHAVAELKAAEVAAAEMFASDDEIKMRRKIGEREGREFAASLSPPN